MTNATDAAFTQLTAHYEAIKTRRLTELFSSDPQRFEHYSTKAGPFLLDWSKTAIDDTARNLLSVSYTHLTLPTIYSV